MDWRTFTLRDLWHLFDEEEKARWQQAQLKKMFPQQSYMDGLDTYPRFLWDQHQKLPENSGLQQIFSPEEYQKESAYSYDRATKKLPKSKTTIRYNPTT